MSGWIIGLNSLLCKLSFVAVLHYKNQNDSFVVFNVNSRMATDNIKHRSHASTKSFTASGVDHSCLLLFLLIICFYYVFTGGGFYTKQL